MGSRIAFLCVTLFWVAMNLLLWRSEFGSRDALGTPVPVELVWRKVLTAPDHSALQIRRDGTTIG